jgi:hypothetical protein
LCITKHDVLDGLSGVNAGLMRYSNNRGESGNPYDERARGGVGMIIQGSSMVHPTGLAAAGVNEVWSDDSIPSYAHITRAVHEAGAKIFGQLSHLGRQGHGFATHRELWVKVGGMDAAYGAGTFEDVDYCFKVRTNFQKEVLFVPGFSGTHYVGGSIKKGAGRQGFNLALNQTVFRGRWARQLQWDEWRWL